MANFKKYIKESSLSNFEYWKNFVADMPTRHSDGSWYDLETGFPYDPKVKYNTERKKLSDKGQVYRNFSKSLGGLALKGSIKQKQKEWGEQIRAEKLKTMTPEQQKLCLDKKTLLNHSKFWIENRNKSGKEIGEFIELQVDLLEKYRKAYAEKNEDLVKTLSAEYNELTSNWGFK